MAAAVPTTAVLLAAGSGSRIGTATAKQFLALAGEPMFLHSLRVLHQCPRITSIVLAFPPDRSEWPTEPEGFSKLEACVPGGATRQESLARALDRLPQATQVVAVHDAARPMLTRELAESLLRALDSTCDGVIPATVLADTIKRVSPDMYVTEPVERDGIWRVQTPQVFHRVALADSLQRAEAQGIEATDCSHLLTMAGYRVRVVPGDPQNFKVTHPGDIALAEAVLERRTDPRGRRD